MNKEEQKVLNEFLSKTLKIDEEGLATLYNEAGDLIDLKIATEADAFRMKKQSEDRTSQYNRGLKEASLKLEKELKSKYEIESDLQGVELVESIVLSKIEETSKDVKDISKHPKMVEARLQWEKEQQKRDKEWEGKLKAKDEEFAVMKIKDKVKTKGLTLLDEFKAIHHDNPVRAQAMRDIYLNELLSKKFIEDENGEPVAIDTDGTPLKNEHGYAIGLKELAKGISDKYYDYQKADARSSAGNTTTGSGGNGLPKSVEDAEKELKDLNITPERRIEITKFLREKS